MGVSFAGWYSLILIALVVACSMGTSSCKSVSHFGIPRSHLSNGISRPRSLFETLRGGSTAQQSPEEEDEEEDEDEDDDVDEEDEGKETSKKMSSIPVKLLVQTNFGNPVLDLQVEVTAKRERDMLSVKRSLSRILPGKPPIPTIELVAEGRVLEDDMLVDELFDEEDEDEDEEEATIILNSIPPVDPKFATELIPKLKTHIEDDEDTLTTEELLEAYFLNQVAIARTGQLLNNPEAEPSKALLRPEMKERADELQEQLKRDVPEEVWQKSLESVHASRQTEEFRGQRYRSGKGGARTNLKKSIQHNLNIDWIDTIKNCLLFLFFGFFGGKHTFSRQFMFLCAPLCFVLQARPVKIFSKVLFYMLYNPPSLVLSLLPAPQQAMLSMNEEGAYSTLYGMKQTEQDESDENEPEAEEESDEEDEESDEEEEDSDDE